MPERVDKTESDDLVDAAVVERAIAADAVTGPKIGAGAVSATQLDGTYPDGSIQSADLGFSPNVPPWENLGTISLNGTGPTTFNLADSYEQVKLAFTYPGSAPAGNTVFIQLDGVTSADYNTLDNADNRTSGVGQVDLARDDCLITGEVLISADYAKTGGNVERASIEIGTQGAKTGYSVGGTIPSKFLPDDSLSSITLTGSGSTVVVEAEVYAR